MPTPDTLPCYVCGQKTFFYRSLTIPFSTPKEPRDVVPICATCQMDWDFAVLKTHEEQPRHRHPYHFDFRMRSLF